MCDGIARVLKPGGRFVTVNGNPALNFSTAPSYRQYGFETSVLGPWQESAPITWTFHLSDGPFDIENYHLDVAIHEEAFHNAGFQTVRWHPPNIAPDGITGMGAAYWYCLLDRPPVTFIECVK